MKIVGAALIVGAAFLLAGCQAMEGGGQRVAAADGQAYGQLLALFPEDAQGYGADNFFPTSAHQPMTYGLVLSAETLHFGARPNEESRRRIRKAARWLVDHNDLDGDGLPGWGLPQAWDAFQDGSTNPENHPYTITTAIVMNGLLDALAIPSFWSEQERDETRRLLGRVALRWCKEVWSEGFGGGFFWYSPSRADAIFTVNAPSMLLGSISRFLAAHGSALSAEERRLVGDRADALARAIVNTVRLRDGRPYWDYMAVPNVLNLQRPNDLVHHVYTVWGIETYRDCGGRVELPWTRAAACSSINAFWNRDIVCDFPQDVVHEGAKKGYHAKPAVLWSAGMMLAGYAKWGDRDQACRALRAIGRDYGPLPRLRLYPNVEDDTFHPRQAAHVLLGLALYCFGGTG
jgi:hypothetical protein